MTVPDVLAAVTGLAWTVAYVAIIYRGVRDRTCGMPFLALALNITWEFIFAFLAPSPYALQVAVNVTWFLFDVAILALYVRYRRHIRPPGTDGRLLTVHEVLVLATCFAIQYAAAVEFAGGPVDAYSALFSNFVMSVVFVDMVVRNSSTAGQSMVVAVSKMVGSAAAALLIYDDLGSGLVAALGVSVLLVDVLYTVLLHRRLRAGAARSVAVSPT